MNKIGHILLILLTLFIVTRVPDVYATEASLSCSPATGTYNIGDTFTVNYVLNTRTYQTYGADIIATYDPQTLEAVGTQSTPLTSSTNWATVSANTVDNTLGKIDLNFGNQQPVFTGNTAVGQITFRAKAAGQAEFQYSFFQDKDNSTPGVAKVWGKLDANAAVTNILSDVTSCIYVISPSATTPTIVPTNPPAATAVPTIPRISELPRSGAMETALSVVGVAGLFLIIGLLIPVL